MHPYGERFALPGCRQILKSLKTTALEERRFEYVALCRGIPKCLQSITNSADVRLYHVTHLRKATTPLCFAI